MSFTTEIIEASTSVWFREENGWVGSAYVECPSGKITTGGGYYTGEGAHFDVVALGPWSTGFEETPPRGWYVTLRANGLTEDAQISVTVRAVVTEEDPS